MEIFGDDIPAGNGGEDGEQAANLLGIFIQELDETVANLEQKLVELESAPTNLELINATFRSFHNLKGSSTMVGLKTLPELMHFAESVFDHVRSGRLAITETMISLLLDVFGAMRELRLVIKETGAEGKKRYFSILALLEKMAQEAEGQKAEELKADPNAKPEAEHKRSESAGDDEFIKISRSLVEQLMLVVGDFMLVESSFQYMKSRYGGDWSFLENCQQLAHFSNKLQSTVLRMRLSPIKPIFQSMHRVVRATSTEVHKKVTLEINGADTLVDRSILDVIADPIMHMLRNAVDHGMEAAEERVRAGKSAEGQVTLAAFHKSGEVMIQISDDGKGIDPERIRTKAVQKGFLTNEAAQLLSENEAQQLIFLPGFSGAEVVTSVSGRGVGMDVVKRVVESLGGNVDLMSNPGSGTTITMRLPLSMAISECLEFRLGGKSYAVAQLCIDEVFSMHSPLVRDHVQTVNAGGRVLLLRDTPIPVLDLAAIFGIEAAAGDDEDAHVVQVKYGSTRFALKVGKIVGPCNIVCQPLPAVFAADAPFSGLTRRGDGSLMFQVDLGRLAGMVHVQQDNKSHNGAKIRGGTAITSSDLRRLQQKIAVFKNYEYFCVPVHGIKRIVSVMRDEIHAVDGKRFITLEGKTVPLVSIEETLLKKPWIERQQYPILIYQVEDRQFGMPLDNFGGIVRMPTQFDNTIRSDVVTGSTVIDGNTYMVVDLFGLAIKAYGGDIKSQAKATTRIKRIAVAEDDPFFREQVTTFLRSRDLDCIAFPDGMALKEHLMVAENVKVIDAVLTDVEMPRMDGLSLTRWIKGNAETKHLPCMIITALTNKEVMRLAVSAGASAFIPKMHHQQVMVELKRIESGLDMLDPSGEKNADNAQKETSRRVVTFTLGHDTFAMPMEVLKEVSHISPHLPVPNYPLWMSSVTAFRGKMVPVIDLGKLFNLPRLVGSDSMQQAIVDFDGSVIALLFDTVGEVLLVSQLTAGEGLGKATPHEVHLAQYLRGIFQKDQKLVSLIDPGALVKLHQHRGQTSVREGNAA